jgi:hypothetical protein
MRSVKGALVQPHTITPREASGIASTPVLTESLTSDYGHGFGAAGFAATSGCHERTSSFDGATLIGFPREVSSLASDEVGAESLHPRSTKTTHKLLEENGVSLLVQHMLPLIRFTSC